MEISRALSPLFPQSAIRVRMDEKDKPVLYEFINRLGGRDVKKINVVVPYYNVSVCMGRCKDHLIRQTIGIENIEIILVNDASTDNGAICISHKLRVLNCTIYTALFITLSLYKYDFIYTC